jgi:hypothetical protein
MKVSEVRWNDEARAKIVADADEVLRAAVADLAGTMAGHAPDDVYEALNARIKNRFIDYQPGPDVRTYADAIAAGEVELEGAPS